MDWTNIKSLTIPEGEVRKIVNASGTVIWEKPSEPGGDYTFVESIVVPSRTTLDTGMACKSTDYYFVDFEPMVATAYGAIIHAGTSKILRVYIDGKNIQMKVDWYNQNTATAAVGTRLNMSFANQITYLNGAQKTNMSGASAFTPDTNVIIGGLGAQFRLYGCKHGSSADNLDFDYVPAVRNNDNVAGLYDNISGEFLPFGMVSN